MIRAASERILRPHSILLALCAVYILAGVVSAFAGTVSPAGAAIYDYLISPEAGETFEESPLRIFLPDSVVTIRGVYFCVDPHSSDSRYVTGDPVWQERAASEQFALMGARLTNVDMASGIGAGILRGLDVLAQLAGHPELTYSNFFFEGYSWGGQFSYHFTQWRPDRVIGFITQKGGYHNTDPAGAAIEVPGYMFIGELDLQYRIDNLTGIFEEHRPLGAVWALAMQPGSGHQRITDRKLLDPFYHAATAARLPADIPPSAPVHLLSLDETTGWLGNRETHAIGSYECYNEDIGLASWLAKRPLAVKWQSFVSDETVTDTIPCVSTIDDCSPEDAEPGRSNRVLHFACSPNPFITPGQTTVRFELAGDENITISIFDIAGRTVRTLHSGRLAAGAHQLHWNGRDRNDRTVAPGMYLIRLTGAARPGTDAIRVLHLN